jgi:uncharacterized protein (UPF0212 family)
VPDADKIADATLVECLNCDDTDEGACFIDPDNGEVRCPTCGENDALMVRVS